MVLSTLKGGILRRPRVLYAIFVKGFVPTSFQGRPTTMALDILVDEKGVIKRLHYGKGAGDHMPMDIIREFAHGESV